MGPKLRVPGKNLLVPTRLPSDTFLEMMPRTRSKPWVDTLLYTDFAPAGKIHTPVATDLAQHAIRSLEIAENAKDGITYLIDAIKCGIETPLTHAFRDEILRLTGAPSLDEALKTAARTSPHST
jgi:hypothetical protein